MNEFLERAARAEAEIQTLQCELNQIKSQNTNSSHQSSEMEMLKSNNAKLKYQIKHLKRSIEEEKQVSSNSLVAIMDSLKSAFQSAIETSFPALENPSVVITPNKQDGYQCNSAMSIAGKLKAIGQSLNSKAVAAQILENLPKLNLIDSTEVVGPGFINIKISNDFITSQIANIVVNGVSAPNVGVKRKVIVDMSSPNIAKEMHVGHLRSTIIGDTIARLCQFVGHNVLKLNHLGDWGTQFGMLIAHLQEKFPDYRTVSPPIGDLMSFYREAKKRFDGEEVFKKRAYASVVKLQNYEDDSIKAWNLICDESRKEFKKIYKRFDIDDLIDRGESFYQPMMGNVVEKVDAKGMSEVDEGRKIAWAPGQPVPLTLVKSDGGFTYDTSDLTAVYQRIYHEHADWIFYVVDNGQAVHLNNVFALAKELGWYDPQRMRIEHIGFGVVLGEERTKFKTRSGDVVRLVELLDEGLRRASAKLEEKDRQKVLTAAELEAARDAVAYGCIKYADLSHNRIHDYVFSFDKMLEDKGNTAVYLQYAYMRIRAIARTTGVSSDQLKDSARKNQPKLEHPKEWKLAKHILRFSDQILRCMSDLQPHTLCEYLYDLATIFTEFYDACYVVEKNRQTGEVEKVNIDRLMLCEATAAVMNKSFWILGIRTVDRM